MVHLRMSFAALLLLMSTASLALEGEPPHKPLCREYGQTPVLRICRELDAKKLRSKGDSATWTIRVEGGSGRSEIRLHNHSPTVVQLAGGNDQIVRIDRGDEIKRKVTSITLVPGAAVLEAMPYSSSPEREAVFLAQVLAPQLERAEARFIKGKGRLSESGYSAGAVGTLLNSTESELLDILSYPELAALRGYVQVRFREARIALSSAGATASAAEALPAPQAIPALWTKASPRLAVRVAGPPSMAGGAMQKEATDSVLAQILRTIHRLLETAKTHDLYTRLCVVSTPDDARFMMHPQISDASERMEINTNGELQAYRGLYVFSIRKSFRQRINCEKLDHEDCFLIDLVDDPKPVLHCSFDKENCERRPGPVPAGVCHDNGA